MTAPIVDMKSGRHTGIAAVVVGSIVALLPSTSLGQTPPIVVVSDVPMSSIRRGGFARKRGHLSS
jgi:hypothetical protein